VCVVVKADYQVLETMNKMTKEKYSGMGYLAENLNTMMGSLQEKCLPPFFNSGLSTFAHSLVLGFIDAGFAPFLEQIDQIEENVNQLEEATRQLDEYSKKLGWWISWPLFLLSFSPI